MAPFPAPERGVLLTRFIVSEDIARSRDFHDKPAVTLTAPDPDTASSFLSIRVADIHEIFEDSSAKGAQFDGRLIEVGQANRDFLEEHGLLESARAK